MTLKDDLSARYGRLLAAGEICKELKYPSIAALRAAERRGRLPFRATYLPGRPGIFAKTEEIAEILERALVDEPCTEDVRPNAEGLED